MALELRKLAIVNPADSLQSFISKPKRLCLLRRLDFDFKLATAFECFIATISVGEVGVGREAAALARAEACLGMAWTRRPPVLVWRSGLVASWAPRFGRERLVEFE